MTDPTLPLQSPPSLPTQKWWPSLLALIGGTAAFLAIAADEIFHGQLFRWNLPVGIYLHAHATPAAVIFFSGLSAMGSFGILFPYGVIASAFLLRERHYRATFFWGVALIGSIVLNEALKHAFRVPRPSHYTFYVFPPHSGYSFPSGHTMGAAIAAGVTVLFASHLGLLSRRATRLAALGAIALSLLVAFALLYMGVHTLTEVLAALAVSIAWLGAVRLLILRYLPPRIHPTLP